MNSVVANSKNVFLLIAMSVISSFYSTVSAQDTTLKSRIAVVSTSGKTSIWVSDFPKKTSVVVTDNENNLLSIISTNEFGAAFLSLPTNIKNVVIVKTLNGEIIVSNQAAIKNKSEEQNVVANTSGDLNKA